MVFFLVASIFSFVFFHLTVHWLCRIQVLSVCGGFLLVLLVRMVFVVCDLVLVVAGRISILVSGILQSLLLVLLLCILLFVLRLFLCLFLQNSVQCILSVAVQDCFLVLLPPKMFVLILFVLRLRLAAIVLVR